MAWQDIPWLQKGDSDRLGLLVLRSEMLAWYKDRHNEDEIWNEKGSEVPSPIWNLTLNMLGDESDPCLACKGAEAHGLLGFGIFLLEKFMNKFRGRSAMIHFEAQLLLESGKAAQKLDDMFEALPPDVSLENAQKMLGLFLRHVTLFQRAGGFLVPKHHLMIHAVQKISRLGNPRFTSCYHDESLNGVLAKISRSTHKWTWAEALCSCGPPVPVVELESSPPEDAKMLDLESMVSLANERSPNEAWLWDASQNIPKIIQYILKFDYEKRQRKYFCLDMFSGVGN
eukprot:10990891-Karenia_brevis.AAC.1